jgi:hypothetical protein
MHHQSQSQYAPSESITICTIRVNHDLLDFISNNNLLNYKLLFSFNLLPSIPGVKNIERNLEVPFNDIPTILGLSVDPLLFICARMGAVNIAKSFISDGADLEINRVSAK